MRDKPKVTFAWGNYVKPTPSNLKRLMEFWKGAITFVTVNNFFQGVNPWVGAGIAFAGYMIDRAAKFFAMAEADEAKSNVTVSFPSEMSDKVTITENEEIKP